MKILFVIQYAYPHIGGAESHVNYLTKELAKLGCKIKILTSLYDRKLRAIENFNNVTIERLPVIFTVYHTPLISGLFNRLINEEYDIVHLHFCGPYYPELAAIASNIKGKPMIVTHHGVGYATGVKGVLEKCYDSTLLDFAFDSAEKIIIPTPAYFKTLKKYSRKLFVIPNGVDTNEFRRSNIKAKEKVVLFVGKLLKYKGLDVLLTAMKKVDAKLVVVGFGDESPYKKLAEEMGISNKVTFLKSLSKKDLVKLYNKCSLLVLPSIKKTESFGMVLIEAMACGKPVIGSNIGGIPYVIENGKNGLLVTPKDSEALAKAINYILGNSNIAKKMGDYGWNLCKKKYAWPVIAKQTLDLYKKVLGEV